MESDQLKALLIEYRSMRQQVLEMTTQVRIILSIGLPAIIFMLIYGWTNKSNEILFCLPVVALLVLQLVLWSDTLGLGSAGYNAALTEKINELVGKKVMLWEKAISPVFASQGITFLGTHIALYFVIIGAVVFGIENSYRSYPYPRWEFTLLLATVIIMSLLTIISTIEMSNAFDKAYRLTVSELNK